MARILIVEHDPVVGTDLFMQVDDMGHEAVGPVGSAYEAMREVRQGRIDGAFLDCKLIGEDSREVADALSLRGVPFAYVTGVADFRESFPGWPSAPVLLKPISANDITGFVSELAVSA